MNANSVLVIDARSRELKVFVASATQAQADNPTQLVLRHALDLGNLGALLSSAHENNFIADMPVLVIGSYSAMSSAGFTTTYTHQYSGHSENMDGHRKVVVVGGLGEPFGKGGLKVLALPIAGHLIRGPVEISAVTGAGNSNWNTATAAEAGAKMLAAIDRRQVILAEGQSDVVDVYRLRSVAERGGENKDEYGETRFPAEHQADRFTPYSVTRSMLWSQSFRALRAHLDEGEKPSDEAVETEVARRISAYRAAKERREEAPWNRLGKGFGEVQFLDEAINGFWENEFSTDEASE
jgi:hypothetical protein